MFDIGDPCLFRIKKMSLKIFAYNEFHMDNPFSIVLLDVRQFWQVTVYEKLSSKEALRSMWGFGS